MSRNQLVVLPALFFAASCLASCAPDRAMDLVSDHYDWVHQTYRNSRGITSVAYDKERKCLVAQADLDGSSEDGKAAGEVFLELRLVPEFQGLTPLDLSKVEFTVEITAPKGFGHPRSEFPESPNFIQAFVKSGTGSEYSPGKNTDAEPLGEVTYRLVHVFKGHEKEGGFVSEKGFSPDAVTLIGVKFGLKPNHRYRGPLYIKSVRLDPAPPTRELLNLASSPDLPGKVTFSDGKFELDCKDCFVVGANLRGIEYGSNCAGAWFPWRNGFSLHTQYLRYCLGLARDSGIKVLRVFLLDDGRAMFDEHCRVVGYDDSFKADVKTLLDTMNEFGLKAEIVLLDYLVAGQAQEYEDDGVTVRGRSALITDAEVREGFIKAFLKPFLREFGPHPALLSIDLLNEPEWMISTSEGGGWEGYGEKQMIPAAPLTRAEFHAYAKACISAIRAECPGLPVTVGISCQYVGMLQGTDLDYYGLHNYLDNPQDIEQYVKLIPKGKPWTMQEYPAARETPVTGYLDLARDLGASGASVWSLDFGIDKEAPANPGHRDEMLQSMRGWTLRNKAITNP